MMRERGHRYAARTRDDPPPDFALAFEAALVVDVFGVPLADFVGRFVADFFRTRVARALVDRADSLASATLSESPIARRMDTIVEKRGLPFAESARYTLSRSICALSATFAIPCAVATCRNATSKT